MEFATMEGSATLTPCNALTNDQDSGQNSNFHLESKPDLDYKFDGTNSLWSDEHSTMQHEYRDNTRIKLEQKEPDISTRTTDGEIDDTKTNSNPGALSEEMSDPISCHQPEIKMENVEEASTSHVDDAQSANTNSMIENSQNSVSEIPKKGKEPDKSHKCLYCDMTFHFKSLQLKHMLSHSEERPFLCVICEKAFKRKDDLAQHTRTHKKDKGESRDCKKRKSRVKASVSSDRIKQKFISSYNQTSNLEELTGENEANDSQSKIVTSKINYNKRYDCPSCNMSFSFVSLLRNHMVIHSEERPFECPACPKSFKRKYDLIKHKKVHPGLLELEEDSSSVKVENISETQSNNVEENVNHSSHISHLREIAEHTLPDYTLCNSDVEDRPFKCSVCDLTFRLKSTLLSHIVIHSEDRPYRCSICRKGFKRTDNLAQHRKTHEKKKKKSNLGKRDCKKTKANNTSTVKLPNDSAQTSKKGATEKEVDDTSMSINVGDRPYQCTFCNFAFRLKTHLTRHLVIHSGERPHACSVCKKRFKRKDDMIKHERNHNVKDLETSRPEKVIEDEQGECDDQTNVNQDCLLEKSGEGVNAADHTMPFLSQIKAAQSISDDGEKDNPVLQRDADRLENNEFVRGQADKSKVHDCSIDLKSFMDEYEVKNNRELENKDLGVKTTEMLFEQSEKQLEKMCTESERFNPEISQDQLCENSGCNVVFNPDNQGTHSKWHVCSICKKSYIREADLKMHHKKIHESNGKKTVKHQRDERPHKCSLCGMAFRIKGNLKIHMLKHSDEKPFGCNVCKKAFKRKYDLDKHKEIHSRSNKNICNFCGRVFKSKHWLEKHMKFHESENSLQCSICKKVCQNKGQFIAHVKGHKKSPSSVCPLCGKSFTGGTNLKQHLRRHKGEKPFKCTICTRSFVSKGEMMRHVNSHTREKSYMCDVCGNEFTLLSSLRTHARIHSGVKPFKCSLCPKTFNQSHHLKTHLRSHLGDKPYKCPACDKAFSDRRTLKNHMLRHPNYVLPAMSNEKVKREMGQPLDMESLQRISRKLDMGSAAREQAGTEMDSMSEIPYVNSVRTIDEESEMVNLKHISEMPYNMNTEQEGIEINDMKRIAGESEMATLKHISEIPYDMNTEQEGMQMDHMKRIAEESEMANLKHMSEIPQTLTTNSYRISQELQSRNIIADDLEMEEIMRISEGWETNKSHESTPNSEIHIEEQASKGSETDQEDPSTFSDCEVSFNQETDLMDKESSLSEDSKSKSDHNTDHKEWLELSDRNVEVPQRDEKPYICFSCNVSFKTSEDLEVHLLKHLGDNEEPFTCSVCKKTFEGKDEWQKHKETHSDNNEHTCSLCGKEFRGKRWLENHMTFHENGNSLQCAVCKKICQSKGHFMSHIKGHKKVSTNVCTVCGKGFTSGNNLKQHLRRHKGEKPFKCTICTRSFVSKGEMMRHVNSHTREKSYMCDICGNEFTLLSSLRTHARIHSGVKPFKCTLCPKSFVQSHHLKTHLRSHLGDKPHKCTVCEKSFSDRRTLRNHLLRHTGQDAITTNSVGNNTVQSEAKILHTPHGELLNLNFNHVYHENY